MFNSTTFLKENHMKLIYIPIDERPCNTTVVKRMIETNKSSTVSIPPKSLLGIKKHQPM